MYHDDPKIREFFKDLWLEDLFGDVDILGCYCFDKETGLYHRVIRGSGLGRLKHRGENYRLELFNEVDYKDVKHYLKKYHPERYYARILNVPYN